MNNIIECACSNMITAVKKRLILGIMTAGLLAVPPLAIGQYYSYYPYYYGSGALSVNPTYLSLSPGGSQNVTVTGGSMPLALNYVRTSNVFQAYVLGNVITVSGIAPGNASLQVCSSDGFSCANVSVSVTYQPYYSGTGSVAGAYFWSPVTFSEQSVNIYPGQSANVTVSGGFGTAANVYYVGYNSNTTALKAVVSGNVLNLEAKEESDTVVVVCASSKSCGSILVRSTPYLSYTSPNYYPYNTGQQVLGASGNWTFCANEGQFCSFSGTTLVRYGAYGKYFYRTMNGGAYCSDAIFGDPEPTYSKQCHYAGYGY